MTLVNLRNEKCLVMIESVEVVEIVRPKHKFVIKIWKLKLHFCVPFYSFNRVQKLLLKLFAMSSHTENELFYSAAILI